LVDATSSDDSVQFGRPKTYLIDDWEFNALLGERVRVSKDQQNNEVQICQCKAYWHRTVN